jgi:hypothetical protein
MRFAAPLLVFFGLSCVPFGDGTGEIQGSIQVERCTVSSTGRYAPADFPQFSLSPTWFFAERRGDVLQIRIQRDSRGMHETDSVVIDVRDVAGVQPGVPVEVRPDVEPDGGPAAPARIAVVLKSSCPRFLTSLLGRGTITFTRFEPVDEGIVEAAFSVTLVDGQSARLAGAEVTRGSLAGNFRMQLHLVAEPG